MSSKPGTDRWHWIAAAVVASLPIGFMSSLMGWAWTARQPESIVVVASVAQSVFTALAVLVAVWMPHRIADRESRERTQLYEKESEARKEMALQDQAQRLRAGIAERSERAKWAAIERRERQQLRRNLARGVAARVHRYFEAHLLPYEWLCMFTEIDLSNGLSRRTVARAPAQASDLPLEDWNDLHPMAPQLLTALQGGALVTKLQEKAQVSASLRGYCDELFQLGDAAYSAQRAVILMDAARDAYAGLFQTGLSRELSPDVVERRFQDAVQKSRNARDALKAAISELRELLSNP